MATLQLPLNCKVGTQTLTAEILRTADTLITSDPGPINASATQQVVMAVDVSAIKAMYLLADHACSIKTNSSGSPDATVTLVAGEPRIWWDTCAYTNPLGSTDITTIYIVNTAGAAVNVNIRILMDGTP